MASLFGFNIKLKTTCKLQAKDISSFA